MGQLPLVAHTAIAGTDDPDVLLLSRKHVKKLEAEGWQGGHRRIAAFFTPSAGLQKSRWSRCRFNLEQEFPEEWDKYVADYTREMRHSFRLQRQAWDTLLSWQRVVIVCGGENIERAVRTILARDILTKLGASYAGELG